MSRPPVVALSAYTHTNGFQRFLGRQLWEEEITWITNRMGMFTWRARLEWYKKIAEGMDPQARIVGLDAWDVLMPGFGEELRALAEEVETILFGAERGCWPFPELVWEYEKKVHPALQYRFLNAGVFIARAGWFASYLDQYDLASVQDDQGWWTHRFLEDLGDRIELDLPGRLVHNCFGDTEEEVRGKGGRIVGATRGNLPIFVHANGKSRMPQAVVALADYRREP